MVYSIYSIYTLENWELRLGRRSFRWRFRGGLAVGCLPWRQNAGVFTEVATLPRNTCETTRQIRQELTTYILNIYIDIHVCIKIWCNWDFDTAETHDSSPLNIKPTIMDKKIYQDHLSMTWRSKMPILWRKWGHATFQHRHGADGAHRNRTCGVLAFAEAPTPMAVTWLELSNRAQVLKG